MLTRTQRGARTRRALSGGRQVWHIHSHDITRRAAGHLSKALKVVPPLPIELVPHDGAGYDGSGGDDREKDEEEDHDPADLVSAWTAVLTVAAARRLEHALVRVEVKATTRVGVARLAAECALARKWHCVCNNELLAVKQRIARTGARVG